MSDLITSALRNQMLGMLKRLGDVTYIGANATPVKADWSEASRAVVERYLDESEWNSNAYEVTFPISVLTSHLLRNGSELRWNARNWKAVARRVGPDTVHDDGLFVTALAVIVTRS